MDGKPPDDPDASDIIEGRLQGCFPALEEEQDKKDLLWMGGVVECFSTIFSLFSQTEIKPQGELLNIFFSWVRNVRNLCTSISINRSQPKAAARRTRFRDASIY